MHTIYDLMEKAQDPNKTMICKWIDRKLFFTRDEVFAVLDQLIQKNLIEKDMTFYWITDSGYAAMSEWNREKGLLA